MASIFTWHFVTEVLIYEYPCGQPACYGGQREEGWPGQARRYSTVHFPHS